LGDKRFELATYEKKMESDIMTLNNVIGGLKIKSEKIDDKKSKLKNAEQETSNKQLGKITQLSRILMAIDNLEEFCANRKRTA